MIKENELRVGNLVAKSGEEFIADHITIRMAHNYNPIPLTEEWLKEFGFEGKIWFNKSLGKEMVGEDGVYILSLGQTAVTELPYHVLIKQKAQAGFTIQEAAKIQNEQNDFNDEAFYLKKTEYVSIGVVYYVHQLQNLFYVLTGNELSIKETATANQ